MTRNLKKIFLVSAAAVFGTFLYAEAAVSDYVNSVYYDQLMKNKSVKIIHEEFGEGFDLALKNEFMKNLQDNKIQNEKNNYPYLYERLIILDKKQLLQTGNSTKNSITISDVSKVMRSLSTMKGIKYYSKTHRKERVLYDKVYLIESEINKSQIPDNKSENANGLELFCLQNDASFGECIYRLNYLESPESLYVTFTNVNPMGLGIIKAIDSENLRINVVVTDCGDSLLLYLATDANCKNILGVKGKISDSLDARMDAVYNWFTKQF